MEGIQTTVTGMRITTTTSTKINLYKGIHKRIILRIITTEGMRIREQTGIKFPAPKELRLKEGTGNIDHQKKPAGKKSAPAFIYSSIK